MENMKRYLVAAAALLLTAVVPSSASATTIELGALTASPLVAPSCPKGVTPANCTIILTQVTAVETVRSGVTYPTTVAKAGRIVAFTLGLSRLSSNRATAKSDIHYLDQTYGGTTQAAITVLRPTGAKSLREWKVVATSPIFHLQPYLGQIAQFPLTSSLAVSAGDVIALTTPTWAPVLSIQQPTKKFAYRQSRTANCNSPPMTSQAQLTIGETASYICDYPGTRAEYSATEITNPVATNPIHAPDRRR